MARMKIERSLTVPLFAALTLLSFLAAGCSGTPDLPDSTLEAAVTAVPLSAPAGSCSGSFHEITLDHTVTVPGGDNVRMFEANGSGLAINDLDNDGDLDLVLANHAGDNAVLWNDGRLSFRRQPLKGGDSRSVSAVDLDDDGWVDIVFSRRVSAPNYWRNDGDGGFTLQLLPGIDKPLYSMDWADLDGDGDLDMVGATYDAGMLAEFGQEFLSSGTAGVYYYQNNNGRFTPTRLAGSAQALALSLHDVNDDGQLDILVGNDFAVPDYLWLNQGGEWERTEMFDTFTHSTMSYDFGDINNDGHDELFATDMKPYPDEQDVETSWGPMMEMMMSDPHDPDDPQRMENVLQVVDVDAEGYRDAAGDAGVDATGWSWSGKFGDLDQDGFLDLYVVNGFMEYTTFGHLPQHELVEENQAFRNDGEGHFQRMPAWRLNSTASGRGMVMADLDMDGDLDIVVNNLRSPAQLFENRLCQGQSVEIDLRWEGSGNSRAVGAIVELYTSAGVLRRNVRVNSGYLSSDPSRLHFGFPEGTEISGAAVHWPDGEVSVIEGIAAGQLLTIER